MSAPRVTIAGGGLAAVRTAQTLRDLGHEGDITLLSAESEAPYDRPPLSKGHLAGDFPEESLRLLSADDHQRLGLDLRLGSEVAGLDPGRHLVRLADGSVVGYDRLVVATGARARMLPVLAGRPGAFSLRTADDSRRLRRVVAAGGPVAVVGGGFIGLEVAATARSRGCPVTVIEAAPAPLAGVVGADVASWLQGHHAERGVEFRCGTSVAAATDSPSGRERLVLTDGSTVDADAAIVGVGVVRDVAWLRRAGLETADGLVCDADGRTSVADVFGAGDIVCHRTATGTSAIGHWTAAGASARRTAHAVLGRQPPVEPEDGFFWSDQYALRLQFAGQTAPGDVFTVSSGSFADGVFRGRYGSGDRVTAVLAVNDPRGFLRERLALRNAQPAPAV